MAKQKRKTLESFTDPLGQVYKPGDLVAISIITDRSPRTAYGIVENTFAEGTKGEPLVTRTYSWNTELNKHDVIEAPTCHVQVKVQHRTRWGGDGHDKLHTYKISDNITKINL